MNHVERFRAVMNFQPVDRLPRWEWAMWWDESKGPRGQDDANIMGSQPVEALLAPDPNEGAPDVGQEAGYFTPRTIRLQAVAADGSRRILLAAKMAPTAVGGYLSMKYPY
jgi:hypothetical protein